MLCGIVVIMLQVKWMSNNQNRYVDPDVKTYTKMIERQTMRLMCEDCMGAGFVRNPDNVSEMLVCSVCYGMGMHQVRKIDDLDVFCPRCRGMGRIMSEDRMHANACDLCKGRGAIRSNAQKFDIRATKVICDNCDGRGIFKDENTSSHIRMCEICFGLGSKLVRKVDAHEKLCAACGGMGRLIDQNTKGARFCKNCEGRGLTLDTLGMNAVEE